jgi:hypothetical protein
MKTVITTSLICLTLFTAGAGAADDPNEAKRSDKHSTEAGLSNNKHQSQAPRDANTSGTFNDNKGQTRDYKTGRVKNQ